MSIAKNLHIDSINIILIRMDNLVRSVDFGANFVDVKDLFDINRGLSLYLLKEAGAHCCFQNKCTFNNGAQCRLLMYYPLLLLINIVK